MPPPDDLPTASMNGVPSADSTASLSPPPPGSTIEDGGGGGDPFARWLLEGPASERYRRENSHKHGGLGEVWAATDTVLDRPVALKTIRPDKVSPHLTARFYREARVTGQLEHPNIVPVYDLVQSADGPAYVMRFVRGRTLAEEAKTYHAAAADGEADPLGLTRLLNAVTQVCEAVAFAHSRGVLHRDLKGQNILLGPFGEVCLADWGLAKVAADPEELGDPSPLNPSPDGVFTEPGAIMGTLAFMAPELARREKATERSDVYGLGAVLYQVLTNTVPNTGTTPDEVLSKLESGVPALPARQVNPAVPAALAAVCEKALRRLPEDRYESAKALAADLRAYLAGEPVGAYPEPFRRQAERWVKRHRSGVLAAVVGLAMFALAAGTGAVLLWQANQRTEAEKKKVEGAKAEVEKEREETGRQRDNYQHMLGVVRDYSDRLTDVVIDSETGTVAGAKPVADRQAALDRAVAAADKLAAASPDDPELQERLTRLLRYTANLARVRNDRPTADKSYRAGLELVRKRLAARPGDPAATLLLAGLLREQAHLRADFGELNEAAAGLAEVAGLAPGGTREAGMVAWRQAEVDTVRGKFAPAADAAVQSVRVFDQLAAGGDRLAPMLAGYARNAEAVALREAAAETRKYVKALDAHADAVARLRSAADSDDRFEARAAFLYALLEQVTTERLADRPTADLLPDAERATAGWRRLADVDPGVPAYRHLLAQALVERGRLLGTLPDPTARGLAAADLAEAEALTSRLRADARERPDYCRTTAEVLLAKAGLLVDKAERRWGYRLAFRFARSAVTKSPADRLADRLQAEVVATAKREDINPAAKAVQPGREADGPK